MKLLLSLRIIMLFFCSNVIVDVNEYIGYIMALYVFIEIYIDMENNND